MKIPVIFILLVTLSSINESYSMTTPASKGDKNGRPIFPWYPFEKPGSCPLFTYMDLKPVHGSILCKYNIYCNIGCNKKNPVRCNLDDQCPGNQKCCLYRAHRVCRDPIYLFPRRCQNDSNCSYGMNCCLGRCFRFCPRGLQTLSTVGIKNVKMP